jgi:Gamma-glutamyltranspeptidase
VQLKYNSSTKRSCQRRSSKGYYYNLHCTKLDEKRHIFEARSPDYRDILARNGSAMDAAIAALFCNGVVNCQSMGLGGGFLMTIYQRDTKEAFTLNAREAAPTGATEDLYNDNPKRAKEGIFFINEIQLIFIYFFVKTNNFKINYITLIQMFYYKIKHKLFLIKLINSFINFCIASVTIRFFKYIF